MGLQGSQKLAVMLCRFSSSVETEAPEESFFRDLFVTRGVGGLNDYWIDASLGNINLDGTEVFPWKTLDQTRDEYIDDRPDRASKIEGAVELHGIERGDFAGVVALFDDQPGDSGAAGGVLGGPGNYNVTFLAHEVGHLFGLSHSYDQSTRQTNTWSAPGEYWNRHDLMSAMNVHTHMHQRFGTRGPLLCAGNLDRVGWLPKDRVWKEPTRSSFSESIDLVPLGHPELRGYLAANIGGYYVEFRTRDRWDAGIPRPAVLIHSMYGENAVVMASDLDNSVNDWQPGQSFGPSQVELTIMGGVRITVASIDMRRMRARISVTRTAQKRTEPELGLIAVGDGWVLLEDVVNRVPPKSGPLLDMRQRGLITSPLSGFEGNTIEGMEALRRVMRW